MLAIYLLILLSVCLAYSSHRTPCQIQVIYRYCTYLTRQTQRPANQVDFLSLPQQTSLVGTYGVKLCSLFGLLRLQFLHPLIFSFYLILFPLPFQSFRNFPTVCSSALSRPACARYRYNSESSWLLLGTTAPFAHTFHFSLVPPIFSSIFLQFFFFLFFSFVISNRAPFPLLQDSPLSPLHCWFCRFGRVMPMQSFASAAL